MNRLRLEFAAELFLATMRREFVRQHPERAQAAPFRELREYAPGDRSALMKAVGAAIKAGQSESDGAFRDWCERRVSGVHL